MQSILKVKIGDKFEYYSSNPENQNYLSHGNIGSNPPKYIYPFAEGTGWYDSRDVKRALKYKIEEIIRKRDKVFIPTSGTMGIIYPQQNNEYKFEHY